MTDFELSLVAVGGAFIVLVIGFNKWQEYKAKKSVDQAFTGGHDDVLMNPQDPSDRADHVRHEPSLDFQSEQINTEPLHTYADAANTVAVENDNHNGLPVDELIDCVVPIEFETPVRGEKLLVELSAYKYVGKKPVHFVGLDHTGARAEIAHGGAYTSLFAGVQMVSRSGPLNELEYSEFVSQLRMLTERFNAHADIPDMNRVMTIARELHQFVAEHDAQLSVNVVANGAPWEVASLLGALEKLGFDMCPDGRLLMPDGEGGALFSLSLNVAISDTSTNRLTLLLDVPCVAPARDAFGAMAACARSLATRLGGAVVDDGGQAISKAALDDIAVQVQDFYGAMAEAQIPAGSLRAQRLFS